MRLQVAERVGKSDQQIISHLRRGASPLGLPCTLSREPLRRLAPFAWLASLRLLASSSRRLASLSHSAISRCAGGSRELPRALVRLRLSQFLKLLLGILRCGHRQRSRHEQSPAGPGDDSRPPIGPADACAIGGDAGIGVHLSIQLRNQHERQP